MSSFRNIFRRRKAEGYPGRGLRGMPAPVQAVILHRSRCTGCGACADACRFGIIRLRNRVVSIRRGCTGCASCIPSCHSGALEIRACDEPDPGGM